MKKVAAAVLGVVVVASGYAHAETLWQRRHPRQTEVLGREHHQIARVNREQREGEITAGQAAAMRQTDRGIAAQDRADSRANGGYITRTQQRQLNREENAQSQSIGR